MCLKLINLFILGSYLVANNNAIKCYECGDNNENSISCSHFQIENPRFIRHCDAESKSCRLSQKVNENIIIGRSCEKLKLNDCKTANSIEFCYCTTDLCNQRNPLDDEEDEEDFDLIEGSGTKKNYFGVSSEAKNSPHDIAISTKTNGKLPESIKTNIIPASSCSALRCTWCSVSSLLIYYLLPQLTQY